MRLFLFFLLDLNGSLFLFLFYGLVGSIGRLFVRGSVLPAIVLILETVYSGTVVSRGRPGYGFSVSQLGAGVFYTVVRLGPLCNGFFQQ